MIVFCVDYLTVSPGTPAFPSLPGVPGGPRIDSPNSLSRFNKFRMVVALQVQSPPLNVFLFGSLN